MSSTLSFDDEPPVPVNQPFERVPQHASDPGFGPVPPESNVVELRQQAEPESDPKFIPPSTLEKRAPIQLRNRQKPLVVKFEEPMLPIRFSSSLLTAPYSFATRHHNRVSEQSQFLHGCEVKVRINFTAAQRAFFSLMEGMLPELVRNIEIVLKNKTILAVDDPALDIFRALHECNAIDLVILPDTDVRVIAEILHNQADTCLMDVGAKGSVEVESVEVIESTGDIHSTR